MSAVREHANAVAALLTDAGLTVTLGEAGDEAVPPFVVLYPSTGFGVPDSLADPVKDLEMDFQLTCVGSTVEQALWAADKARTAVDHITPTVSGRVCWPIWSDEAPPPVRRDTAVNPPMFVAISRWCLRSTT